MFLTGFDNIEGFTITRVATQPGKPGEPGKVRELDISPKNHGKVRVRRFIQKPGKVREFEKKFKT